MQVVLDDRDVVDYIMVMGECAKYIADDTQVVLFMPGTAHADMAEARGMKATSAGFVSEYGVYGNSSTLGLECDTALNVWILPLLEQ